jgi:hypothetical protein
MSEEAAGSGQSSLRRHKAGGGVCSLSYQTLGVEDTVPPEGGVVEEVAI